MSNEEYFVNLWRIPHCHLIHFHVNPETMRGAVMYQGHGDRVFVTKGTVDVKQDLLTKQYRLRETDGHLAGAFPIHRDRAELLFRDFVENYCEGD